MGRVYLRVCACTQARMYACVYIYIPIYIYVCMCAYVYISTYLDLHVTHIDSKTHMFVVG